ncbi:hypothetical protein D3C80_1540820 [compost metagenome]
MLRTQIIQRIDNHVRRAAARMTFRHHAGGFNDMQMSAQHGRNIPARRCQAAKHFQKALWRFQNINAPLHLLAGEIRCVHRIAGRPSGMKRFDRRAELPFGAGSKTDGIAQRARDTGLIQPHQPGDTGCAADAADGRGAVPARSVMRRRDAGPDKRLRL